MTSMPRGFEKLQPADFWRHFCELSRIPRCSRNEAKIRSYIIDQAARFNLDFRVDAAGNLVVVKPASGGHASRPTAVLQCHLDMVCEKEPDLDFDFDTDPIQLIREGDWLRAGGTTLGADNGVGIALCLAFLENKDLRHGPVELLFTVAEEIGLIGAHAITPEMISGRILINLDSEDISTFYIGCAGSRFTRIHLPMELEPGPREGRRCRLLIGGLTGGHSGLDIHRGRANALKLLGRLLAEIQKEQSFFLMNLKGGSSLNAIPRFAEAEGLVPAGGLDGLGRKIREVEASFMSEFHGLEPALSIGVETGAGGGGQVLSRALQEKVIHLLMALPHGITRMEELSPGLVKTSTNLATIGVEDGRLTIGTKQRSSENAEMQALSDMVRACGALAGAATEVGGDYPGWKPERGSALLAQAESTYMRLLEKEPVVASIHAGLECGLLTAKIGGLDAISIGATIRDAHSPRESLQIASVQTLWDFVTALLADIGA
jgi:dipeptidase D